MDSPVVYRPVALGLDMKFTALTLTILIVLSTSIEVGAQDEAQSDKASWLKNNLVKMKADAPAKLPAKKLPRLPDLRLQSLGPVSDEPSSFSGRVSDYYRQDYDQNYQSDPLDLSGNPASGLRTVRSLARSKRKIQAAPLPRQRDLDAQAAFKSQQEARRLEREAKTRQAFNEAQLQAQLASPLSLPQSQIVTPVQIPGPAQSSMSIPNPVMPQPNATAATPDETQLGQLPKPLLTENQKALLLQLQLMAQQGKLAIAPQLPAGYVGASPNLGLGTPAAGQLSSAGNPPFPLNLLPADVLRQLIRKSQHRTMAKAPPAYFGSWRNSLPVIANSNIRSSGFHSYMSGRSKARVDGRLYRSTTGSVSSVQRNASQAGRYVARGQYGRAGKFAAKRAAESFAPIKYSGGIGEKPKQERSTLSNNHKFLTYPPYEQTPPLPVF